MAVYYDQQKYESLREEYSFLRFQSYDYHINNQMMSVKFSFSLDDKYFFYPSFEMPSRDFYRWDNIEKELHHDSLWYFLTNSISGDEYQTRIDLVLDLMAKKPLDSKDKYYIFNNK